MVDNDQLPSTDFQILITGGTGFAGSHLVEELLFQGTSPKNIHVTSFSGRESFVHSLLPHENIHTVDLTSAQDTFDLFELVKPTQIYHLASYSAVENSFDNARDILANNTDLQLNLLEAIKAIVPNARMLFIGSAMEYDLVGSRGQGLGARDLTAHSSQLIAESSLLGPTSPYAVSKVTQDMLAVSYHYSYDLDIVRARPFNHIGERQTPSFAVPSFAKQIVEIEKGNQDKLMVGNLDAIRDFTDVKDMVKAYVLLMEKGETGEVYNIGTGTGYRVQDVLDWLCELSQTEVHIEVDPDKIRPLDVPVAVADNSKIVSLGWQPTIELKATLQRILDDWRNK